MPDQTPREDVYDPTNDPRHRPPPETPGPNPDVPRPRGDPSADPPPPGENPTAPNTPEPKIDES